MKSLLVSELLDGYRARRFSPLDLVETVLERIERAPERHVWIARLPSEEVLKHARSLASRSPEDLPLYGVPFAIKDNIDLSGVPTTAACPQFAYLPQRSARVVQKLIDAGAIPIGKTNMDQFATGLVGTRSPYGVCRNSFDERFISGGSSSGSAVAVASGLVSFALGTDTAGSGRVPAAFNNIVGLKPSCGRLSTRGVVPACRSLDCVSIFALTSEDARLILEVAAGFDPEDPFSREPSAFPREPTDVRALRIGVPKRNQLEFFGDEGYAALFEAARNRAAEWATLVEIDFAPFLHAARLLYEGPWVAERYAAIERFLERQASSIHPVTRGIIAAGADVTACDAFRAQYRLRELARATEPTWRAIDALMLPTAPSIYRIADVLADPVRLNSNLGYYTNFVNLLDLAAAAVPAGFRGDGLPFGVTFVAPSGADELLLCIAGRFHHALGGRLGAGELPVPAPTPPADRRVADDHVALVVCGAHMQGLPLNHQLTERGASFVETARTAARYRLYALAGEPPRRPGLVRCEEGGAPVEVELWAVPTERFGSFVAEIPAPLGIGKVELEDGSLHSGFLCEAWAVKDAEEITRLGGWRRYLQQLTG